MDEKLTALYAAYRVDMAVYSSYSLDGGQQVDMDLHHLTRALTIAGENHVPRFVLLYTNAQALRGNAESPRQKTFEVFEDAGMAMCRFMAEHYNMGISYVHVPRLYSTSQNGWLLSDLIRSAGAGMEVKMPFYGAKENDFLAEADLGELLARIADAPAEKGVICYNLSGHNLFSADEIADRIRTGTPAAVLSLQKDTDTVPGYLENSQARTRYGWSAVHSLEKEWNRAVETALQKPLEEEKKQKEKKNEAGKDRIRTLIEIIVVSLIAEGLNRLTEGNMILNFLDFRLISVMAVGMTNGLMGGLGAGLAATVFYLLHAHVTLPWQVILFDLQNWLPFAAYLFLGAAGGYTHDRNEEKQHAQIQEYRILEEKYSFLSTLYQKVLSSNDAFNQQILGYSNSFGKIYSMVKKLDAEEPDAVVYAAVSQLEDILHTRSAAIYFLSGNSSFARLAAATRQALAILPKSIRVTDYPQIMNDMEAGRVFINRSNDEKLPSFAAPIMDNGKVAGMVMIVQAEPEQMNMEFANRLFIITDLAGSSLIRARKESNTALTTVEGTRIYSAQSMQKVYAARLRMSRRSYVQDLILHVDSKDRSMQELDTVLGHLVRNNDTYGLGKDGELYVILHQAGTHVDFLVKRFEDAGLDVQPVAEMPE